jgi:two-component system chemotaxis response regulator CheY
MQKNGEKRKVRVLVVDDEQHIRQLICLVVTSLGAEVVGEASDGIQAVELYKEFSPEIVMLDVNMPKLDGISVLKKIMAINPRALVVMLTSLDAIDVVKECIDHGARNYILKNLPAEELRQLISETWGTYVAEIRDAAS